MGDFKHNTSSPATDSDSDSKCFVFQNQTQPKNFSKHNSLLNHSQLIFGFDSDSMIIRFRFK